MLSDTLDTVSRYVDKILRNFQNMWFFRILCQMHLFNQKWSMMRKIVYFENFAKSYLRIVIRCPRYLKASSGCKKFKFWKNFKFFMFFMHFCIQSDQIQKSQKIAKNAFFWKNRLFPNGQQAIVDGQKWSQIVPQSVQNTFLTNIWCLHPF